MKPQPHKARPAPTHLLSAVMLWLAAVLTLGAGIQQVAPPDAGQLRPASTGAARSGGLPLQRSTAPSAQMRMVLVTERALEAVPASSFDGPDPAIVPDIRLDLPALRAAHGGTSLSTFSLSARASGFRARAPPILT
ncbi:hypothetical protein [Mesorhizobium australicum]|uniref:Uncharacterized protein n=1 Tax=Mesorhizobium australicum TaxID=536018 RepID=A0A1X7PYR5_9HYPH|nr:hypothetical protein [Mesorhizobium australicum]SMH56985.1 hypothetical protein SAMN02982922_5641 [Mesorhizobium australicum]